MVSGLAPLFLFFLCRGFSPCFSSHRSNMADSGETCTLEQARAGFYEMDPATQAGCPLHVMVVRLPRLGELEALSPPFDMQQVMGMTIDKPGSPEALAREACVLSNKAATKYTALTSPHVECDRRVREAALDAFHRIAARIDAAASRLPSPTGYLIEDFTKLPLTASDNSCIDPDLKFDHRHFRRTALNSSSAPVNSFTFHCSRSRRLCT